MIRGANQFFLFAVALSFLTMTIGSEALAKKKYRSMPSSKQFEALDRGQDCSSFRSVLRDSEYSALSIRAQVNETLHVVKARRNDLDQCAKSKGIQSWESADDAGLLAEVCPDAYQNWLRPSYRVEMLLEDIENSEQEAAKLRGQIAYRCKKLPAMDREQTASREGSL